MARRRNYGFERKQREAARVSRLEAKKARKTERDETGQSGPEMGDAQETTAPAIDNTPPASRVPLSKLPESLTAFHPPGGQDLPRVDALGH